MRTSDLFRLSCGVSKENYISQEYNAFDWSRFFFGGLNQLSRALSWSQTTIDNPHIITYMVTGKLTELGKYFNAKRNMAGPIAFPMHLFSVLGGEYKGHIKDFTDDNFSSSHSTYKTMFFSPKKINFESDYDKYVTAVDNFVKGIEFVKTKICKKIAPRHLTLGEKNQLKLFRPKEVLEDMKSAQVYVESRLSSDPALKKKWEALYKKAEDAMNGYINHVLSNVKTGVIKQ